MVFRVFFARNRVYETALAVFSVAWGLLLAWPGVVDYQRPAYRVMHSFAPQWAWGGLIAIMGLLLPWSLARHRQQWRMCVLAALFVLWLAVGLCLGLPNVRSTGFLTYFFVATTAGIAHVKAARHE